MFDIVWFIEQSKKNNFDLKPNWDRLKKTFPDTTPEQLITAVIKKIQTIDNVQVYEDLMPFIESRKTAQNFREHYASIITQNIKYFL